MFSLELHIFYTFFKFNVNIEYLKLSVFIESYYFIIKHLNKNCLWTAPAFFES